MTAAAEEATSRMLLRRRIRSAARPGRQRRASTDINLLKINRVS